MTEIEEELKSLLMKVKEESEKAGQKPLQYCKVISPQLIKIHEKKNKKLNIQKTNIMASGPIISPCQADGEKMETVTDFIFLGLKITADGDCGHEIKRRLYLGRKALTNLDSILKSRDIALLTKVHIDKATIFPVVMYGYESWTVKKAEN